MNVEIRPPVLPVAAVIATWAIAAACIVEMLMLDLRLADVGRSDLQQMLDGRALFLIPFMSAALVGSALVIRRPEHPVGWLFLLLASVIPVSGAIDGYAAYGAIAKRGSLPGADTVAVIGASTFIPMIMLPGLILLLTPAGRLDRPFARAIAWTSVCGGLAGIVAGLLSPYHGDYESLGLVHNPLELTTWTELLGVVRWAGIAAVHLGVVAGAAAIIVRFRAAREGARSQLRWLGLAAIPCVLLLFAASVAAVLNQEVIAFVMVCLFIAILPLGIGLSIERHHLYDVDQLLSQAATWTLLTAAVISTYCAVVVFVGQSIGRAWDSAIPVAAATLATAISVNPLRRYIQDALDRHFNRRRFEIVAMLRDFAREPAPNMTVEEALRAATGDAGLIVAYWISEREIWANEDGSPRVPRSKGLAIKRGEETVCVIGYDPQILEAPVIAVAAAEVRGELENARLRAAIALQLVEVRESRTRIVEAQLAERHRIERDLHDGAQQQLLGLAMRLRAVELSGDSERVQATVAETIDELQAAVRDLRALANGLRPAVLVDGGLAAALDDLAARSPVPVRLDLTGERFGPQIEETAWFIACEAVANAVKHATPCSVAISTSRRDGRLRLVIEDDGCGGANPLGGGLRGIADRAEAAGGSLSVAPRARRGTVVTAELPCVS